MNLLLQTTSFLVLLISTASCTGSKGTQTALQEDMLLGTWVRSSEEDTQTGSQVYRRPNYAFPPSRGRSSFTLNQGGKCSVLSIAPTDGLQELRGTWHLKRTHLEITLPNQAKWKYTILQLDTHQLILQPILPK